MTEISKDGFWKWSKFGSGNHDGWLYQENSESEQNISKAGATDNSDCKKPKMRNEQNKDENVIQD